MKSQQRKTIVVTGGAGFIGSHLCARLHALGHMVISLDNYFAGSRNLHTKGVDYREGHTKDIGKHIQEIPDIIYHLGEYSRTEKSFDDMFEVIWDLNIEGTLAVLEFAKKSHCKIVYAGSSTKFADEGTGKNQSPYAWSKYFNTELVKNFGDWYGLSYAITYFYNVYGPQERSAGPYATLIAIFLEKYRRGEKLEVVLPGTQKRNFTHVDDIIDGLLLVGAYGSGDGFGIGAAESYSVREVAGMFGSNIVMLPERRGNRMSSPLEISRTIALGWKQKHTLEKYLQEEKGRIEKEKK